MKVKIGKYKDWWVGPYQICNTLKYFGVSKDTCFELGEKLEKTWVSDVCQWIYDNNPLRKRKIKVKIDYYDTWCMSHTLGLIILPMLKQLQETKHGSPYVDDKDVPEHLRSTAAPPKEDENDVDNNHHLRWDWVLNEMIWAFEQIVDEDSDDQFYTGEIEHTWTLLNPEEPDKEKHLYESVRGPNDTSHFDKEGFIKHHERKQNGLRLFGTYFSALWD